MTNETYEQFLQRKQRIDRPTGFDATNVNPMLFPFQRAIVEWACRRGRAAIFADCGLGKTGMQLEWADQVNGQTGGKVLILAPLAVAAQTAREASKFGIGGVGIVRTQAECEPYRICIANYEMLQHFDPESFAGVVLDESSILKAFTGKTKRMLVESFRNTPFRLACTATPAPNDYLELQNHAEFLGAQGHGEMLARYFVADSMEAGNYRLKKHAERAFWHWVHSWAVSIATPSDLGFPDDGFALPPLVTTPLSVTDTWNHRQSLVG
jgi:superfamily II DNA or RNA helicase